MLPWLECPSSISFIAEMDPLCFESEPPGRIAARGSAVSINMLKGGCN
jgi:hypothetical protein